MMFEKWRKKKGNAAHDQTDAAAGADPRPEECGVGQGCTDMDGGQMRMVEFAKRTAGQPEASYVPSDHSLLADLHAADEWATDNLNKTGYKADHTLESMREVERFIDENPSLFAGKSGSIVFSLGAYVGETIKHLCGGRWVTDDQDPQGELYCTVEYGGTSFCWPVIRVMKRVHEGWEEGDLYGYVLSMQRREPSE